MSPAHALWSFTGSTLRPITLTLRLANSGLSRATSPSSVVQTGVKSFGCENSTAQPAPSQSWKRIGPSVESCVKSGAASPRRSDMETSLGMRGEAVIAGRRGGRGLEPALALQPLVGPAGDLDGAGAGLAPRLAAARDLVEPRPPLRADQLLEVAPQ